MTSTIRRPTGCPRAPGIFGAALDGFAAAPFPLRFDPIENRKAVTLRTREPLAGARAFQKTLVNHPLREKAPILDGRGWRFRGSEPRIPKDDAINVLFRPKAVSAPVPPGGRCR